MKNNQSFSVRDIRKIREADHERWSKMTPAEIVEDIRKGAEEGHKIIAQLREQKKAAR